MKNSTEAFYEEEGVYYMTKEECYTKKCPDWIKVDSNAMTIEINGRRNKNKQA